MNSSSEWLQCKQTNTTFLDCPVADHLDETFYVAIQNPSSSDGTKIQFAVPNGHYEVNYYDDDTE
jgi:hypothetical protein